MKDNKLIAEFMGAVGTPKYNPTEWDVYITGCLDVDSDDENAQHFYTPDEMKYHTSWDWLMPVIHRIRDHVNVDMGFEEYDDWRENFKQIDPYNYSLEQCYKAVVEFIKQYDNQRNAHS